MLTIWTLITATVIWVDPENIVDLVIPGVTFVWGFTLSVFSLPDDYFPISQEGALVGWGHYAFLYLRLWGWSLFNAF